MGVGGIPGPPKGPTLPGATRGRCATLATQKWVKLLQMNSLLFFLIAYKTDSPAVIHIYSIYSYIDKWIHRYIDIFIPIGLMIYIDKYSFRD